jgi:hypothetical protein
LEHGVDSALSEREPGDPDGEEDDDAGDDGSGLLLVQAHPVNESRDRETPSSPGSGG